MGLIDTTAAVDASGETKLTDAELLAARKYDAPEYERLCKHLGFSAPEHFVQVTPAGAITYTLGHANEVRDLHDAVIHAGYRLSAKLAGGRHTALGQR